MLVLSLFPSIHLMFSLSLFSHMPIWGIVGPKPYLLPCAEQNGALIYSSQSGYTSFPSDNCFIVPPGSITTFQNSTPVEASVFPNPANDQVEIKLPLNTNCSVALYDQSGKLIFMREYQYINMSIPISLSSYQPGLYQFVIATEKANTICRIVHN
jgi:hypothetical protein